MVLFVVRNHIFAQFHDLVLFRRDQQIFVEGVVWVEGASWARRTTGRIKEKTNRIFFISFSFGKIKTGLFYKYKIKF